MATIITDQADGYGDGFSLRRGFARTPVSVYVLVGALILGGLYVLRVYAGWL